MAFSVICLIYVVGLTIIIADLFLPGSFLSVIGSGVLLASIILAFYHHEPIFGLSLVFISCILIPLMFLWWLKQISLNASFKLEDGYIAVDTKLEDLMGQEGITVTVLRPIGIAKIGEKRVDVTSENTMVPQNTRVKVIKVEGNRIVVEPIQNIEVAP
jgi:membrane-bound serine protease (ClpP class)